MFKIAFILIVVLSLTGGFYIYLRQNSETASSPSTNSLSEISNTVILDADQSPSLLSLSESFQRQLNSFGWDFGGWQKTPKFLNLVKLSSVGDTTKIEILKGDQPFLTVFELNLPDGLTYDNIWQDIKSTLAKNNINALPAAFGEQSFYFLDGDNAMTILPIDSSAFGFQYASKDFEEIKKFIATLMILN